MYEVTFQDIAAISEEEILTQSFKLTGFFHLLGESMLNFMIHQQHILRSRNYNI